MMTPIRAVLSSWSWVAGRPTARITELPLSYASRVMASGRSPMTDEVVLLPDKVIRCRFDLNHEVFPSGFYDVRWFRADNRGKLIEITRERFQLRNHSFGSRTGSASRTPRRLATKPLPTGEDEIKPRRAVEAR